MIVTHNIQIDFTNPGSAPCKLNMVQGDANTRAVAISLTENGEAFQFPAAAAAMVRYRKTDGTGGVYDTMPDGTAACSINGNTVTVLVAPQMLTCPGMVWASAALTDGNGLLGTFHFAIQVQADPSANADASQDYYSYDTMSKVNEAIIQALAGVESIDSRIANAMAQRSQLEPVFVNSVAECSDPQKLYVLPDGYLYAYLLSNGEGAYINHLKNAVDASGEPYNGGQGWKADTRLNSSGVETAATGIEVTGFIPFQKGDVLRFENMKISGSVLPNTSQYIVFYNSAKTKLKHFYTHNIHDLESQAGYLILDDDGYWHSYNTANLAVTDTTVDWSDVAYFRISAEEITDASAIIINEEKESGEAAYGWGNTGHAFVPADYEDRIIALEEGQKQLAAAEDPELPAYWQSHCEEKAAAIQTAMEAAGRNKSAFLWYTDTHWAYGSKNAPLLLKYFQRHTAMNKVNFGGDIVDTYAVSTEECMDGLRQWRLAVGELKNHHSVLGNHDDDITELATAKQRYGFLMAAEEDFQVVRGGDFYYYIDDPNEKTRYLYLDTSMCTSLAAPGDQEALNFTVNALASTPKAWHVVVISHIWFLYSSTETPTVGSIPEYCRVYLSLFDDYNQRQSGEYTYRGSTVAFDFTEAGGEVEFCIGGHTHVDHDFTSGGGIPVILTETDSRHLRGTLPYATGTITENAISGIVADYDQGFVSVIRIGRGEDRQVML